MTIWSSLWRWREIFTRSGASGGALTRSREGRPKYVGLIDQGEAHISQRETVLELAPI